MYSLRKRTWQVEKFSICVLICGRYIWAQIVTFLVVYQKAIWGNACLTKLYLQTFPSFLQCLKFRKLFFQFHWSKFNSIINDHTSQYRIKDFSLGEGGVGNSIFKYPENFDERKWSLPLARSATSNIRSEKKFHIVVKNYHMISYPLWNNTKSCKIY